MQVEGLARQIRIFRRPVGSSNLVMLLGTVRRGQPLRRIAASTTGIWQFTQFPSHRQRPRWPSAPHRSSPFVAGEVPRATCSTEELPLVTKLLLGHALVCEAPLRPAGHGDGARLWSRTPRSWSFAVRRRVKAGAWARGKVGAAWLRRRVTPSVRRPFPRAVARKLKERRDSCRRRPAREAPILAWARRGGRPGQGRGRPRQVVSLSVARAWSGVLVRVGLTVQTERLPVSKKSVGPTMRRQKV